MTMIMMIVAKKLSFDIIFDNDADYEDNDDDNDDNDHDEGSRR